MTNKDLAPICIFAYKRLSTLRETINSLLENDLAKKSAVFVFSDGPKKKKDLPQIREVRRYLRSVKGFETLTVIEREINYGLARNIIDGVTRIVSRYGRVIVVEDDLVVSKSFLLYLNRALDFYQEEKRVFHISAFIHEIGFSEKVSDFFFIKPTSCWGWATWSDRWAFFRKDPKYFIREFNQKMIFDFNLDGSFEYWSQILQNQKKKIDTWAIFWYASSYLNQGLSLHPKNSFVRNIGQDEFATHTKKGIDLFQPKKLNETTEFDFPREIEENPQARKELSYFFRNLKRKRRLRKLKRFFNSLIFCLKKFDRDFVF